MQNSTSQEKRKRTITIRLDADVLEFFKGTGRGYQTRINSELREAVLRRRQKSPYPSNKPGNERVDVPSDR